MKWNAEKATLGFFSLVIILLAIQVLVGPVNHGTPGDDVEEAGPCIGTPIIVDYAYGSRMLEPHECAVQCTDNQPRYIQYTNGLATQCETPPGCNDLGEDRGVTCTPPAMSTIE